MRNWAVAAFIAMAGSTAHAQTFVFDGHGPPIVIDIPERCADPSCIYVNVPGYVVLGSPRRPPPRVHYGPVETIPDYSEYEERPPYGPPPQRRRAARHAHTAVKKPARKVATAREYFPAQSRTPATARRAALPPVAAPVPPAPRPGGAEASRPAPAQAALPHQLEAKDIPLPPEVPPPEFAATSPAPRSDLESAAPAPSQQAAAAQANNPVVAPTPPTARPPLPAPAAEPHRTDEPRPAPAAAKAPAKPSRTVVAALPPPKKAIEERAKAIPGLPVGVWASSEGQMRVDRCGGNYCGYAVGGSHAGKMVLINMRPTRENHWSGQVLDVRSGQVYAGNMSMAGANGLHIEGCALGGLICGGRTLSRVH